MRITKRIYGMEIVAVGPGICGGMRGRACNFLPFEHGHMRFRHEEGMKDLIKSAYEIRCDGLCEFATHPAEITAVPLPASGASTMPAARLFCGMHS
jgi:hypothetical protein